LLSSVVFAAAALSLPSSPGFAAAGAVAALLSSAGFAADGVGVVNSNFFSSTFISFSAGFTAAVVVRGGADTFVLRDGVEFVILGEKEGLGVLSCEDSGYSLLYISSESDLNFAKGIFVTIL